MKLGLTSFVVGLNLILASSISFANEDDSQVIAIQSAENSAENVKERPLTYSVADLDVFSPEDKKKFQEGTPVPHFEKMFDEHGYATPWRKATVYQLIRRATPADAASAFFNYPRHPKFMPDLNELKDKAPIKINEYTYHVPYQLRLIPRELSFISIGPIAPEDYTVEDVLSSYNGGRSYEIRWHLLPGHGETITKSEGFARFEDLEEGNLLLIYQSYIVPTRWGSSMVAGSADIAVQEAAKAIAKEVERQIAERPDFLDKQMKKFHEAATVAPSRVE